jgi:hypothetical protein
MLVHQLPEHYYNPYIFGVNNAKLVLCIINAAPTTGQKFFFTADEDLNNKTIRGISLVDTSSINSLIQLSGYNLMGNENYITMSLYNDKNNVIIDNLPISILSLTSNVFVPGRFGKKFKTKFKVNLGSSYLQWNFAVGSLINYPAVVPFVFYY